MEVIGWLGRLRRSFGELYAFERSMGRRYGKDIPQFPVEREAEIGIENIDKVG